MRPRSRPARAVGRRPANIEVPTAFAEGASVVKVPRASDGCQPLAVDARGAASMFDLSRAFWWKLHLSERVPRPVRLGRRTLWVVESLRAWSLAGCPARARWEVLREQEEGHRG